MPMTPPNWRTMRQPFLRILRWFPTLSRSSRMSSLRKLRREVEELQQASEADLQPGTIEYERHRLTRAQADAQELKNARDSAEVVETAFCTFVLSRIAGEIASILDGIPLSVQRRFPELENRHVDFLKRDIIKAMNKAAALDELIPGLLSEYIEQSG
ncbi:terminase small subunit [Escherichia coli]|uniref:terminase small subunit n=1 Tax=Escherichia coli TaxID=562 RepID=UPI003855EF0B